MLGKYNLGLDNLIEYLFKFVSTRLFLQLTFLWFILQGILFAVSTKFGIPPDESYHLSFIKLFAENNLSPFITNQDNYFHLGEVIRIPFFLYHYVFSFIYILFQDNEIAYIVIRLMNVILGALSLFITLKIASEIKLSNLVKNLSLFMLSNTLMFVFLSSSINYDNLFITLSLVCVLFLLRLLKELKPLDLLIFCNVIVAGSLVKINFLPIAAVCVFILLWTYRTKLYEIGSTFLKLNYKHFSVFPMIFILIVLIIFAVHKYGYNIVTYQSISPRCDEINLIEYCRQNAVFARNERIALDAKRTPTKDSFEYFFDWVPLMFERTYGIFSHQIMLPNQFIFKYIHVYVILAFFAFARLYSRKENSMTIILIILLFNLSLIFMESLSTYTNSGRFGFATQGRYLFGVLPLIYIAANYYILELLDMNIKIKGAFVLISLLIFSVSSLPTYLLFSDVTWYSDQTKNLKLKFE
ncbi:MAG: DUF2142 domain-containing protein [bacterium]|nr:DUF2142 domain-containing protein [bacterium]